MNELFCPSCGNKHNIASKYCKFCGENLEEIILELKQKHLPIRYETRAAPQDEEKVKEIEKYISEFVRTEEELNKYDIIPEKLTPQQPMSSSYSQSIQLQSTGRPSTYPQKIKLQRREDPWWVKCCGCCCW